MYTDIWSHNGILKIKGISFSMSLMVTKSILYNVEIFEKERYDSMHDYCVTYDFFLINIIFVGLTWCIGIQCDYFAINILL